MPSDPLASCVAILALALLTPFTYVYIWPRGVTRRLLFLVVTLALALIVAVASVLWFLDAVVGLGIAGRSAGIAGNIALVEERIRVRFIAACTAEVLVEYLLCHAVQLFLKKFLVRSRNGL